MNEGYAVVMIVALVLVLASAGAVLAAFIARGKKGG